MSVKELKFDASLPLSQWPIYYKDGLPFIYDDYWLHYKENGQPMSQHLYHSQLINYLVNLLQWLYRTQVRAVRQSLTFRARVKIEAEAVPGQKRPRPYVELEPDVCLIKGVPQFKGPTYIIGPGKPAPDIVFEIASPNTFVEDLERKFRLYREVYRVKEYVAYDPGEKRLWEGRRLKGWRLVKGEFVELTRNDQGWLWSDVLDSWLVVDGHNLWLHDAEGNRRLDEAQENAARAEKAEALVKQAKEQAKESRNQVREERQRANKAQAEAKEERQRAEQLAARLQELEAQLRQLRPETQD